MKQIKFHKAAAQSVLKGSKTELRKLIDPQPDTTEERLRELKGWIDGMTLSAQLNAAFQSGFIDRSLAPFQPGEIVEAVEALTHGKVAPICKVRIDSVEVSAVEEITDEGIQAEGFRSWAEFSYAWDDEHGQKGFPAVLNPFCWVVKFEVFK